MADFDQQFGGPTEGANQMRNQSQQRELERPISCLECGSTWFAEVGFDQYSDIANGSAPGGDMRIISEMRQTLRVCLCGAPFSPNLTGIRGRTATVAITSFLNSLASAQNYRELMAAAGQSGITMSGITEKFAAITEFKVLGDRIAELHAEIQEVYNQMATLEVGLIPPATVLVPEGTLPVQTGRLDPPPVDVLAGVQAFEAVEVVEAAARAAEAVHPHPNSKAGRALRYLTYPDTAS